MICYLNATSVSRIELVLCRESRAAEGDHVVADLDFRIYAKHGGEVTRSYVGFGELIFLTIELLSDRGKTSIGGVLNDLLTIG